MATRQTSAAIERVWSQLPEGAREVLESELSPTDLQSLLLSLAQTRAALARAPLHSMPLFVLTHGRPDPSGSDPRLVAADERLWRKLQDELAGLVPNSKHVIAKKSGHDIQHEQPQLVAAAIRNVVQAVRDPGTWKTP